MWPYFSEEKIKTGTYSIDNPYNECFQDLSIFSDQNRFLEHVLNIEARAKRCDQLKSDKKVVVENAIKFIEPVDQRSQNVNKKIIKSNDRSSERNTKTNHHERLNENIFSDRSKKQKVDPTYNVLSNIHKGHRSPSWNQNTRKLPVNNFSNKFSKNPNNPNLTVINATNSLSNDERRSNPIINIPSSQTASPHLFGMKNYDIRSNLPNLPSNFQTKTTIYNNPTILPTPNYRSNPSSFNPNFNFCYNPNLNLGTVSPNDPRIMAHPSTNNVPIRNIVNKLDPRTRISKQTDPRSINNYSRTPAKVNSPQIQTNNSNNRTESIRKEQSTRNYSRTPATVNSLQIQTNNNRRNESIRSERINEEHGIDKEQQHVTEQSAGLSLPQATENSSSKPILSIKEYKKINIDDKPSADGYNAIDLLLNGYKSKEEANLNKRSSNEQPFSDLNMYSDIDERTDRIIDSDFNPDGNVSLRDFNMNVSNHLIEKSVDYNMNNSCNDHSYYSKVLNVNNLMETEPNLIRKIDEEIYKLSKDQDEGQAIESEMRMFLDN